MQHITVFVQNGKCSQHQSIKIYFQPFHININQNKMMYDDVFKKKIFYYS